MHLQDILFTYISLKQCRLRYGPIIAHAVSIWRKYEKLHNWDTKWHDQTPLFYNPSLRKGDSYFVAHQWTNCGLHTLGDIMDDNGLRTFSDLKDIYNLSGSSFFLYLQLRSAMRAYGVPWSKPPSHPLLSFIKKISAFPKGHVSLIYKDLFQRTSTPLPVTQAWNSEFDTKQSINWVEVWGNISLASRNPNHQMIHFNFIHKTYLTPQKRYKMKLTISPNCLLCSLNISGSFLHMMWECSPVKYFWEQIAKYLSKVLQTNIPCCPELMLLNDDDVLSLNVVQRHFWLVGSTAAKKC